MSSFLIVARNVLLVVLLFGVTSPADAQRKPTEDDYYRMITFPLPDDVVLEAGGLEWLDEAKTKLAICTRRGEVWLLQNPYADDPVLAPKPTGNEDAAQSEDATGKVADSKRIIAWKQMLFGLHEPLGLLKMGDSILTAQRGEVTKLTDTDGDDRFDSVRTLCDDWEISGSYHEYAFGPKFTKDGKLMVTLNRAFGGEPEGKAYWRGWTMEIDPETGEMTPFCFGLRSPAGFGQNADGEMFYTDNQGDWVAVCKLSHLTRGSFQGNPLALHSIDHPDSPFKDYPKATPPSGLKLAEARERVPRLVLPAVWFPYPSMGKSHSDVLLDDTGGKFGPFSGQLFVGDQANSIVVRVALEKVRGEYQGACFPFRQGFQCGVLRMIWGKDGSMFVGQTNRGWGSSGGRPYGLERLVWTGKTPFEIHEMNAEPNGFTLTFTEPVDPETASDVRSYAVKSWTYYYHSAYGCNPVDTQPLTITSATVAEDGRSVRLVVDGLQEGYVHEVRAAGVRSTKKLPILHPVGYYTLNRIPNE